MREMAPSRPNHEHRTVWFATDLQTRLLRAPVVDSPDAPSPYIPPPLHQGESHTDGRSASHTASEHDSSGKPCYSENPWFSVAGQYFVIQRTLVTVYASDREPEQIRLSSRGFIRQVERYGCMFFGCSLNSTPLTNKRQFDQKLFKNQFPLGTHQQKQQLHASCM